MRTPDSFDARAPALQPGGPIRAWHQMRWIAAAFVPPLFLFYIPPEGVQVPFPRLPAAAVFCVLLVAANLVSIRLTGSGTMSPARTSLLLAWDAAVVVALQAIFAFDPSLSLWVLSVFPIMGGALLWELRGALPTWAVMLAAQTAVRTAETALDPMRVLTSQVFRGSILLLVALFVGQLVRQVSELIRALRRAEMRLREQAVRDDLTGLANRRALHRQLEEAIARAERGAPPPSLLYVDCDDFKSVNDRLGHAAGDAALKVIARRLVDGTRTGDVPARLGGDEFCVLLQSPESVEGAAQLADRLRRRLAESWTWQGAVVQLRASIGAASWSPGMTAADLLGRADDAMYGDKADARRSVHIDAGPG